MPMPITSVLLLAAIALSRYSAQADQIVVYVLILLALMNEALRFVFTRPQRSGTYSIPAQRQPTPIEYDDGS